MPQPAKVTSLKPAAFVIETNVPMPSNSRWAPSPAKAALEALAKAQVGASCFLPALRVTHIQQAAYRLGGKGWVTLRKEADGYRVWKCAEPLIRPAA